MTPIDYEVLYGKFPDHWQNSTMGRLLQQKGSLKAAIKLHDALESNDLLDLAAAGAVLYDLLTDKEEDKLGFRFTGEDYSKQERASVLKHNYEILNKYHNQMLYFHGRVSDIKAFLIKFYWLSYFQILTENNIGIDHQQLNWYYFRKWLKNMYLDSSGFAENQKTVGFST